MKIALYIEDGLEQIVLTPETETEKAILGKLRDKDRSLEILTGDFWVCKGGYIRNDQPSTKSTMIVLREKSEVVA